MKKIMALFLAVMMLMSMVACGGGTTENEETTTPAAEQKETTAAEKGTTQEETKQKLVIWTNLTADAQYTVLSKQFTELADEMGVEIEVEAVAFNDMYAKLATAVESGEVPDIMHTNFAGTAYLYSQGSIMPVDDVIDGIGRDDFSDAYITVLTGSDGSVYGLPDWAMHTSVWYRKDLFEAHDLEIPTTWEEFLAVAETLTIDSDNDGNTDIYGFPVALDAVQVAPQTLFEMMCSAGVYFMDPETGEYCFGDQKEEAIQVIDYLVELFNKVSTPASVTWSWSDYRNALSVNGTVAMTLDMGAVIGNAQSNNPEMVENLGCFDFPGPDGEKAASFGSGYCFVASNQTDSAKADVVKEFLNKLYTPERAAERALSRPMFAFPSYTPAFEIYKSAESVALFQDEIDYIFDAFENGTWYWYGMENGLSAISAQIESTTFIGEALQAAALGQITSEQAYEMIHTGMQEQVALVS